MTLTPGESAQDPPVSGEKKDEGQVQSEQEKLLAHPIVKAINAFLHRARDVEEIARTFIPLAYKFRKKQLEDVIEDLNKGKTAFSITDEAERVLAFKNLSVTLRRADRLKASDVPAILETSLFLGLFSKYDAFSGDLLKAIYLKKPELFNAIHRSVTISEILKFQSYEELKLNVLHAEIEAFRRKSYVEQFEDLESSFGLKLKLFKNWSKFVECGQRRNLLTHCDGVVTDQYLKICKQEGYLFQSPVVTGEIIELTSQYFLDSCELLMEVALKLGQTLWRKLFPDEIAMADHQLMNVILDSLRLERWTRAQVFGEFAMDLKKYSTDIDRKIHTVNYAIALKFGGRPSEAAQILSTEDWTASLNEFKLAEVVILEKYDDAAILMEKIGKSGELLSEHSYHAWPLFRDFRGTDQFLKSYEKIYGHPFTAELQKAVDAAQSSTNEELKKQSRANESIKSADTIQQSNETETKN